MLAEDKKRSPWAWIPTLYFAQGIPYVTVMTIAVILYKRMGCSNTEITLYTSWLYLPWVLKPLWSPFIDILRTKRWWIVAMQLLIGAGLGGIAFCIPLPFYFQATLAFFWLLAFSSATHDIAADGFYMLALDSHEQSLYVGIRNTFYRIAMITGQGLLIMLAGALETMTGAQPVEFTIHGSRAEIIRSDSSVDRNSDFIVTPSVLSIQAGRTDSLHIRPVRQPEEEETIVLNTTFQKGDRNLHLVSGERLVFDRTNWKEGGWIAFTADSRLKNDCTATFRSTSGNIPLAWSITFFVLAGAFVMLSLYHKFFLPQPAADQPGNARTFREIRQEFLQTFISFFSKKEIAPALFFFLTYRLSESQLLKLASPFLLDPRDTGGLGLSTSEVGLVYGTVGVIALTLGGIIGGIAASGKGLKFWLWPMAFSITLPNLVYVWLAYAQPDSLLMINMAVAIEQFGYGFGFTAYMLYMIYFANGKHKTAHYAICTAFMALGMMLPGLGAGWLQEHIGYRYFFVWVMICSIPAYLAVKFLHVDGSFGIKEKK